MILFFCWIFQFIPLHCSDYKKHSVIIISFLLFAVVKKISSSKNNNSLNYTIYYKSGNHWILWSFLLLWEKVRLLRELNRVSLWFVNYFTSYLSWFFCEMCGKYNFHINIWIEVDYIYRIILNFVFIKSKNVQ